MNDNDNETLLKDSRKICIKCKIKMDNTNYSPLKSTKDKLQTICKKCVMVNWKINYIRYTKNRKVYYYNNKDKQLKWSKTSWENSTNTPEKRLYHNVRRYIQYHLKSKKTQKSLEYLGCTIQEYKIYLEPMFTPEMTWDNYGIYWEIDHIIPTSKGGTFHYTNTQPLTITENRKKSNKILN